jgi:flagellar basal body-associated protein FliL
MSKTAKIMFIIFIIALAVIIYFIMFGKKNMATTDTTAGAANVAATANSLPVLRAAGGVIDPAQRYIGAARPGITPIAN